MKKTRPGDQPLPTPGHGESMHDLVAEILQARKEIGIERYNSILQAFNGRDAGQDAIEEVLDLSVYLMQWNVEMTWLRYKLNVLYNAHIARNTVTQSQIIHEIAEKMGWKNAR